MLTSLSFPSDPVNGAVSGDYTYDAAKGAWRKNAALPVSVTHSDVAPSNPREGDQWWKSDEGTLFTYYNDGSSSQWVESTNVVANVEPNPIPAGAMMAWASDTIPSNWLLCDGSAVSRSTYASLFAAIGTQYGSGDGTTTFNLPDIKGRTIVGKDASQTEFDVLGETGGAKTHTLLISEMPSHTHLQDSHTHTQNSHTHTQNSHNHTQNAHTHPNAGGGYAALISFTASGGNSAYMGQGAFGAGGATWAGAQTATNNATTATNQSTTATNQATTATNQNTGGGEAHNNLQPYIVLNYIIKFSAGETPGDSQLAVRVGTLETQNNATPLSANYAINGALDFWQRGTTGTQAGNSNGFPSADRFRIYSAGASSPTLTLAQSTDVPVGVGAKYSAALSWSSNISGGDIIIHQGIENGKYLFAGKTMTVSFYAKAATAITSKLDFDQDYGETFFNLTTSWARYSYTITLPSTYATSRPSGSAANDNTELRLIRFTSISSTSNTIYFTGLQVEEGSYATPFKRSAPSLQAELAACQRYFETFQARKLNNENYAASAGYGYYRSINWLVEKRAVPTVTLPATTAKNTSNEVGTAFTDGYSYQFASNGAGNFYMLWNAGLIGTASAEI